MNENEDPWLSTFSELSVIELKWFIEILSTVS